jgi:hypothetical protein
VEVVVEGASSVVTTGFEVAGRTTDVEVVLGRADWPTSVEGPMVGVVEATGSGESDEGKVVGCAEVVSANAVDSEVLVAVDDEDAVKPGFKRVKVCPPITDACAVGENAAAAAAAAGEDEDEDG